MEGYFGVGQEAHSSSQICCYDFKETLLNIFLPTLIETKLQIEITNRSFSNIWHVSCDPISQSIIVSNNFFVEEGLKNVFSFFIYISFAPTFHQVLHQRFNGFARFEARSSQELPFKHFKVFGSNEWAHMHSKRRS